MKKEEFEGVMKMFQCAILISALILPIFPEENCPINDVFDQVLDWAAKNNNHQELIHFIAQTNGSYIDDLLNKGANVDVQDGNGNTALHLAAFEGHNYIAKELLKAGADYNIQNNAGKVPNDIANFWMNKTIEDLLEQNEKEVSLEINFDRKTMLHFAAKSGNVPYLKKLLENSDNNVNATDMYGLTPLHDASNGRIAQVLIDHGADLYADHTDGGGQPIYSAASRGSIEIVQILLDKGVQVDTKDTEKITPLMLAARNGHTRLSKFLLDKGANVKARTELNFTALHFACENGHLKTARLLLENGAEIEARNFNNFTALHEASNYRGYSELVKLLLSKGADIETKDITGGTPLFRAADNGDINTVKVLVQSGANVNAKNNYGWSRLKTSINKEEYTEYR